MRTEVWAEDGGGRVEGEVGACRETKGRQSRCSAGCLFVYETHHDRLNSQHRKTKFPKGGHWRWEEDRHDGYGSLLKWHACGWRLSLMGLGGGWRPFTAVSASKSISP